MQVINQEYQRLVSAAIRTLKEVESSKMHVADLAIKACTIKLGGHLTGFYSITNFADDIELNRKTLSCWIHNRKIQIELEKKKVKVDVESDLNKIRIILRGEQQGQQGNINKYSDPSAVIRAYEKSNKISPEDQKIKNMIVNLGTIKFRIGSYVLPKLEQDSLKEVYSLVTSIKDMLDSYYAK